MNEVSWTKHLLDSNQNTGNLIVVMRHAQKMESSHQNFGNEAALTFEGKKAAEDIGATLLKIPLGDIHTSPLLRCVQTTERLLKGAHQNLQIITSTVLGNPGSFVADPKVAGDLFLSNSIEEIAQDVAGGKRSLPGMRTLEEGGEIFLDYALKVRRFPSLMITHDIVICLLCCFFFKSKEAHKFFPNFLEGFVLEINPPKMSILFRNHKNYII